MSIFLKRWFYLLSFVLIPSISLAAKDLVPQVCYQKHCLNLELALTQEQWRVGLMGHKSLNNNTGMLFVFQTNDFHAFWMKNMKFPLDLIWIDDKGIIVDVKHNQVPCKTEAPCPSIRPNAIARYVLEINAGQSKRLGWDKGKQLLFKHVPTANVENVPEHAPGVAQ